MKQQIALNVDCMEYMRTLPDKAFDLAIVHPPYGISIHDSGRLKKYNATETRWDDATPGDVYFSELKRCSKNQIIWGGNYYDLPPCRGFVIWDKKQPEDISFASCEFAWTSFDTSARTFYYSPLQEKGQRIHPTQKPVALYEWLLMKYAKEGWRILDTHLGSGSSRIAAYNLGFEFVGCEIEPTYFQLQEQRFAEHTAQVRMW